MKGESGGCPHCDVIVEYLGDYANHTIADKGNLPIIELHCSSRVLHGSEQETRAVGRGLLKVKWSKGRRKKKEMI